MYRQYNIAAKFTSFSFRFISKKSQNEIGVKFNHFYYVKFIIFNRYILNSLKYTLYKAYACYCNK